MCAFSSYTRAAHTHTPASLCSRSIIRCTRSTWCLIISSLFFPLFRFPICLYSTLHCLPTSMSDCFITTRPLTQFLSHLPAIFMSFSLLRPGANEFWMWSVWGPKLLRYCRLSSWVLPQCTKCLSWILNKPRDHLRASWSTALLLPSYYSARGLGAPSGWMGFESVVL